MDGDNVDKSIQIKICHGQSVAAIEGNLGADRVVDNVFVPADVLLVAATGLCQSVVNAELRSVAGGRAQCQGRANNVVTAYIHKANLQPPVDEVAQRLA